MAALSNGVNGVNGHAPASKQAPGMALRFSDIPAAIDIPVQGADESEAVEVDLLDLSEDPTELCTLLENEGAPKHLWMIIALAYAKQGDVERAIQVVEYGLQSLGRSEAREKLPLLSCKSCLLLWKARDAPRRVPDALVSEARTKEFYLAAAGECMTEAYRINPQFSPMLLARGVLYLMKASLLPVPAGQSANSERKDHFQNAQRCFEEALRVSQGKNMMALMGKARTQYCLGRYTQALEDYQSILSKRPDFTDPDPRIGIGCCLFVLGYKEDARVAWERALEVSPDSKIVKILLAQYYFNAAAQFPVTSSEFIKLYKQGMALTQEAFKVDKTYPLTCTVFSNYFMSQRNYKTAETLANRALENTDVSAIASDSYYVLARQKHADGDFSAAARLYQKADDARGGERGYFPAKFGLAQLQVLQGERQMAKYNLEKIIPSTKNVEALMLLGTLYAEEVFVERAAGSKEDKSSEMKKAISYLEAVRGAWKDDKRRVTPESSVLLNLARLYEVDQPEKSLACLLQVEQMELEGLDIEREEDEDSAANAARKRGNLPPALLNNIGGFYYAAEKYDDARDAFQIGLNACVNAQNESEDTDSFVTTLSFNLARTYEALGLLPEATTIYEGLLARHAEYTDASLRLAFMNLSHSETSTQLQTLLQADPSNLETRAMYGWFLNHTKKRTQNIAEDPEQRHYKHTLQYFDKHDSSSLCGMGNIYLTSAREMRRDSAEDKDKRKKVYQRAVEFFHKALQLDPRCAYAAQGVAIALAEDKKDHSQALQILSKVRDTVKDPSVYTNLGHTYAELRQYARAIESYEAALAKDRGNDPQILACLGRVLLLKGKQDKNIATMQSSLEYSRKALELAPDQVFFQWNVSFVQFQIALTLLQLKESERSLEELEKAAADLDEAIEVMDAIALHQTPPYPKHDIEQRANMGRNTTRRQLDRAIQSQKAYEEQNAARISEARKLREKEQQDRAEAARKVVEEAELRQKQIADERRRIFLNDQAKILEAEEKRRDDERRRLEEDEEKYDVDPETGKKKRKRTKKKDHSSGESSGEEGSVAAAPAPRKSREKERERAGSAPKKRKLLQKANKFKSAELVADSDDEDELDASAGGGGEGGRSESPDGSPMAVDDGEARRAAKRRPIRRLDSDDEDEDEDGDVVGGTTASQQSEAGAGKGADVDMDDASD